MAHNKRFHVEERLLSGGVIPLPDPLRHRLKKVLRLKVGDTIQLWNGEDGLFEATLEEDNFRRAHLGLRLCPQETRAPLALFIAHLKREAWETVLRQATELGVTDIYPLKTDFAVSDKLKEDRARLLFIEACEQCERMDVPRLHPSQTLKEAINAVASQPVFWAYERHDGALWPTNKANTRHDAGVLIGPEGGFSQDECAFLKAQPHVHAISLGTTILRADTAACSALAQLKLYRTLS